MKYSILTLFPEVFQFLETYSVIGKGVENSSFTYETIDIREFSTNKHKKVDDYSYGGGPGMVMKAQPIVDAIQSVKAPSSKVIYLSPRGKVLTQEKLMDLSKEEHLILLNGHYEGIDERVIENYVDEEISIGDYILSGGEIASLVLIDGISRLLQGVLSNVESIQEESHSSGLLEYPHYTRPFDFEGHLVPEVLISGNHEKIEKYRREKSLEVTYRRRPDLLEKAELSKADLEYLNRLKENLKED